MSATSTNLVGHTVSFERWLAVDGRIQHIRDRVLWHSADLKSFHLEGFGPFGLNPREQRDRIIAVHELAA